MSIRKGDRVSNKKTGEAGEVVSDITYRNNAGRSVKQVKVKHDVPNQAGDSEWNVLVRNLNPVQFKEPS
jgi:phage protein D